MRAGEKLLQSASDLAELLAAQDFPRVCFVGSGPLASVAKESALKALEMTAGRVATMSETMLGLRHGPMAALEESTLFVCFVSGDGRRASYALDLLREVDEKKIVAKRVVLGTPAQQAEIAPFCDFYLAVEADVLDVYRPVLDCDVWSTAGAALFDLSSAEARCPEPGRCDCPRRSGSRYLLGKTMSSLLQARLAKRKQGVPSGIYSVCSAHRWVIRAAAEQAAEDRSLLLIEATGNQVNQFGGYTGMRPAGFR